MSKDFIKWIGAQLALIIEEGKREGLFCTKDLCAWELTVAQCIILANISVTLQKVPKKTRAVMINNLSVCQI